MATSTDDISVSDANYNAGYIILSYIVSLVGSCTALELLHRRTSRRGLYNWYLLMGSSISMGGIGIWCMHFIGNRAINLNGGNLDSQVVYSSGFTAASFFLPIVVLSGAFYLLGVVDRASSVYICFSGVLTGLAVCGMHYLGQLGIANYHCSYQIAYVAGAAVIAIFASLVALIVFFRMRANWSNNWWKRVLCGCMLAGAVSGMHWVATVGTSYKPRSSYNSANNQLSRTQTVIVCTVLSCVSCILLLIIAIITNRSQRRVKSRAQQLVLAAAYFDEQGRLMVTTDGQLPTSKITDHYVERSFRDDDFSKTHPAFLWIFRATRNWSTLKDIIPGMKSHLQLNSTTKDFRNFSRSETPEDDESGYANDFELLFKEMFCVAASDLALLTHQQLDNIGVLYEEPLETGTLAVARAKKSRKLTDKDAEVGDAVHYFGQGHFLFVVRNVTKQEASRFAAAGFRFASVGQVIDAQSRSMQIPSDILNSRLKNMQEYATSENLMDPGVHLAAFIMRPNVRKGFDVLVSRNKSNQLPIRTLPIESLSHWQAEIISQMNDMTVPNVLRWLKYDHGRTEPKEVMFCEQFYRTLSELVDFVNDSSLQQAKFSAKRIQAPCRPQGPYNIPGKCTLLSIRVIANLHANAPSDNLIYKPLRLFNAQQQVYAGISDHEAFARQIHREFYHCALIRDGRSEVSGSSASKNLPGSPTGNWWPRRPKPAKIPTATAEKSLVSNPAAFGGIMVSNQITVDVHDLGKVESADSMELTDMGTHGDAVYAAEDPDTFVDELYALFR